MSFLGLIACPIDSDCRLLPQWRPLQRGCLPFDQSGFTTFHAQDDPPPPRLDRLCRALAISWCAPSQIAGKSASKIKRRRGTTCTPRRALALHSGMLHTFAFEGLRISTTRASYFFNCNTPHFDAYPHSFLCSSRLVCLTSCFGLSDTEDTLCEGCPMESSKIVAERHCLVRKRAEGRGRKVDISACMLCTFACCTTRALCCFSLSHLVEARGARQSPPQQMVDEETNAPNACSCVPHCQTQRDELLTACVLENYFAQSMNEHVS